MIEWWIKIDLMRIAFLFWDLSHRPPTGHITRKYFYFVEMVKWQKQHCWLAKFLEELCTKDIRLMYADQITKGLCHLGISQTDVNSRGAFLALLFLLRSVVMVGADQSGGHVFALILWFFMFQESRW